MSEEPKNFYGLNDQTIKSVIQGRHISLNVIDDMIEDLKIESNFLKDEELHRMRGKIVDRNSIRECDDAISCLEKVKHSLEIRFDKILKLSELGNKS